MPNMRYNRVWIDNQCEVHMSEGCVLGIAIHRAKRGSMERCQEVHVSLESGLEGDFRGTGGEHRERQITALSMDHWLAAHTALKSTPFPPWSARRANLCLWGIAFGPELVGKELHFEWNGVILIVTGQVAPCERMNEVTLGLKEALTPDWRGGIACRVVRGGRIQQHEPFGVLSPVVFR